MLLTTGLGGVAGPLRGDDAAESVAATACAAAAATACARIAAAEMVTVLLTFFFAPALPVVVPARGDGPTLWLLPLLSPRAPSEPATWVRSVWLWPCLCEVLASEPASDAADGPGLDACVRLSSIGRAAVVTASEAKDEDAPARTDPRLVIVGGMGMGVAPG